MTGPLSTLGQIWTDMIDAAADFQAGVLRRIAERMAHAQDIAAMRDIEGAREWRNPETDRRYRDEE